MLTQSQIALAVGLELRRTQDYLTIAVQQVRIKNLLSEDEVLIQFVGRKAYYHPIVVTKIQEAINHVKSTRYSRSVRTRRQHHVRKSRADYKTA